jgi:hypothetical protein
VSNSLNQDLNDESIAVGDMTIWIELDPNYSPELCQPAPVVPEVNFGDLDAGHDGDATELWDNDCGSWSK